MPLKVTIELNDRTLSTLHIARISKSSGRNQHQEYEYSVIKQASAPVSDEEWMSGTPFIHAYGDAVEICVRKAIEALELAGEI